MRRSCLNRSEPAKKSGQNIPKNRCRTTVAERMMETLAELPFIGDQVVCLSHEPGRLQRNAIPRASVAQSYHGCLPRTHGLTTYFSGLQTWPVQGVLSG